MQTDLDFQQHFKAKLNSKTLPITKARHNRGKSPNNVSKEQVELEETVKNYTSQGLAQQITVQHNVKYLYDIVIGRNFGTIRSYTVLL